MSEAERLLALAERCETASGPDAALDLAIHLALGGTRERFPPKYTAYIDAIVWQIERRIPGANWACSHDHFGAGAAVPARANLYGAWGTLAADAAGPALALCGVFLRCLAGTGKVAA